MVRKYSKRIDSGDVKAIAAFTLPAKSDRPGRGPGANRVFDNCRTVCLLLLCMFSSQSIAGDEPPEWCHQLLPQLEQHSELGRLVISSQLVAHMRIGVPVNPVSITLTGVGKDMPVVTSSPQCSAAVVFDQLPPGQYRIASIEGSLNILTAPNRFLYPLPGDGYRIIFTGGQTARYRVPVPHELSSIVEVTAGQTSFAGELVISPNPRRIWAINIDWSHQLAARSASCERFNKLHGKQASCD